MGFHRDTKRPGGRPRSARRFSITAVLVVGLAILRVGRAPSSAEIYRMICTLTAAQLQAVGMDPTEVRPATVREYSAFHGWLTRTLDPLDSGADLPARRVSNTVHQQAVADRDVEQRCAAEVARRRLHDVVNALIAGSVDDKNPEGYAGDVVADGTIVDLAKASAGMGSGPGKKRAAAYLGAYYARDGADNSIHNALGEVIQFVKSGFGMEITAVSRVGGPHDLYGVAPVITAAIPHTPTSGSVEGLATALGYHRANGFDPRQDAGPRSRARQPFITVDMGYNVKDGFADLCLDTGYAPVVRYPRHWGTVFSSETELHTYRGVPAGPVQIAGEFYCPVARQLIGTTPLARKSRELEAEADTQKQRAKGTGEAMGPGPFALHDARLAELFPLLMGTNSTPYRSKSTPGRPRKTAAGTSEEKTVRVDVVCPAVQGRVRCPLKPGSMDNPEPAAPTLAPQWPAEKYRCCHHTNVTMAMSPEQAKRAQWGLVPGSWEHAIYYEAARSATEQRFSIMKNQHITGVQNLTWTPRREPLLCVLIGVWIAATNLAIQDSYVQGRLRPKSSTVAKMRRLARDLGHEPTRIPPRT